MISRSLPIQLLRGSFALILTWVLVSLAFGVVFGAATSLSELSSDKSGLAGLARNISAVVTVASVFVGIALALFALPTIIVARKKAQLSFSRIMRLGILVGAGSAVLLGAPLWLTAGLMVFALLLATGAACGAVGATSWWFLFERNRNHVASHV